MSVSLNNLFDKNINRCNIPQQRRWKKNTLGLRSTCCPVAEITSCRRFVLVSIRLWHLWHLLWRIPSVARCCKVFFHNYSPFQLLRERSGLWLGLRYGPFLLSKPFLDGFAGVLRNVLLLNGPPLVQRELSVGLSRSLDADDAEFRAFHIPQPCFTLRLRFFFWNAVVGLSNMCVLWLCPDNSNSDSSVQSMFFQKAGSLPLGSLGNSSLALMFFREIKGFFFLGLPPMEVKFVQHLSDYRCMYANHGKRYLQTLW